MAGGPRLCTLPSALRVRAAQGARKFPENYCSTKAECVGATVSKVYTASMCNPKAA